MNKKSARLILNPKPRTRGALFFLPLLAFSFGNLKGSPIRNSPSSKCKDPLAFFPKRKKRVWVMWCSPSIHCWLVTHLKITCTVWICTSHLSDQNPELARWSRPWSIWVASALGYSSLSNFLVPSSVQFYGGHLLEEQRPPVYNRSMAQPAWAGRPTRRWLWAWAYPVLQLYLERSRWRLNQVKWFFHPPFFNGVASSTPQRLCLPQMALGRVWRKSRLSPAYALRF